MKNKEKKEVKINVKKSVFSIVFMLFVILSSSYLFQSCDPTIISENEEESIEQYLNELNKYDDADQENDLNTNQEENIVAIEDNSEDEIVDSVEYFSIDVVEKLSEDLFTLVINNNDEANVPNGLEIFEFSEERMFGWVNLSGFENNVNNGFYYFEIDENSCEISNDEYSFVATLDFDKCWVEDEITYINIEIEEIEYICYFN
ncbi:MAG: hypothetical protein ACPKM0_03610 [Pleomorphochaeta sp.]